MLRRLCEWFVGLFSLEKEEPIREKENKSDESDTENNADEEKEDLDGKLSNSAGVHFHI